MRPLADLLSPDPARPLVTSWLLESSMDVVTLPTDRARSERVLAALQVTTRSPMGALALETGGLLIDHGWLRVLGGGGAQMDSDLARWNGLGDRPIVEAHDRHFVVAYDAIGGFFALDGGGLGEGRGEVFYFAPDSLEWEATELGYTDWLRAMLTDRLGVFYQNNRWPDWKRGAPPPPSCAPDGNACSTDTDCCNVNCNSGTCGGSAAPPPPPCAPDGNGCFQNSDCCNMDCNAGNCGSGAPPPPSCAPDGNACSTNSDCCNSDCNGGTCNQPPPPPPPPPSCGNPTDPCSQASDCCSNSCTNGACD